MGLLGVLGCPLLWHPVQCCAGAAAALSPPLRRGQRCAGSLHSKHTPAARPERCSTPRGPSACLSAAPHPPAQVLTEAVRAGDVAAVQRLLDAGGCALRPERPLPASINPLIIEATCCGQRDILELVLDRRAGRGGDTKRLRATQGGVPGWAKGGALWARG